MDNGYELPVFEYAVYVFLKDFDNNAKENSTETITRHEPIIVEYAVDNNLINGVQAVVNPYGILVCDRDYKQELSLTERGIIYKERFEFEYAAALEHDELDYKVIKTLLRDSGILEKIYKQREIDYK